MLKAVLTVLLFQTSFTHQTFCRRRDLQYWRSSKRWHDAKSQDSVNVGTASLKPKLIQPDVVSCSSRGADPGGEWAMSRRSYPTTNCIESAMLRSTAACSPSACTVANVSTIDRLYKRVFKFSSSFYEYQTFEDAIQTNDRFSVDPSSHVRTRRRRPQLEVMLCNITSVIHRDTVTF